MAENKYDLIVIGGGPAGYAGAIRAGQLGKRVLCIEMERAGGTCLNWGCIPSKALLKSAEMLNAMRHCEDFGLKCKGAEPDFEAVMKRSRKVADNMGKGIEFLFKKNKVDYLVGKAKITAPGMVEISEGKDKGAFFSADKILVSTGCKPKRLPGIDVDGKRVMTSREALAMTKMPKSVIILGAGAIGAEFAYFLNAMGSKVTLVEMMPQILPVEDGEVSKTLSKAFEKQGIALKTGMKAEDVVVGKNDVSMKLVKAEGGGEESVKAESMIVAIGLDPNTNGLLEKGLEFKTERGYIEVNDQYETSISGVFAAGDIIGPPWLAHVATFEAIQAINGMFGHSKPKRVNLFPGCTYCQPQVASIGMTEERLKKKGIAYKVGKFPFMASGKAVAVNHPEGFVKILSDPEHGEILGAHIIGSDATELITEYGLAMNLEATVEDIHHTIHAHPTMSEALMEAAADSMGEAIHI